MVTRCSAVESYIQGVEANGRSQRSPSPGLTEGGTGGPHFDNVANVNLSQFDNQVLLSSPSPTIRTIMIDITDINH